MNEIIQAHQSDPESNGMFVRGNAINGFAPKNHQSGKISEIDSVKTAQQAIDSDTNTMHNVAMGLIYTSDYRFTAGNQTVITD